MSPNLALVALLALSTPAVASYRALPAQAAPPSESQPLRPVAVVHGGDAELVEKLKRVGEVWHDAGPFVVAALSERDIHVLRARELEIQWLAGLAPTAELFVVDLAHADVRRDIDAAGRIEFVRDGIALVSVPAGLPEYPESLRPGRTCHSAHTAIPRRAMAPLPRTSFSSNSGPQALAGGDPRIQTLVDSVAKANLEAWVQSYTSYINRDSQNLTNFNAGKAQLVAQLASYGYTATSESWNASHGTNIVVDIPGAVTPNRYVVIGAHFDTRNYSGGTGAVGRGADDNTSGSTAVLEIARILAASNLTFANSVRLVWFSGEEYGLLGSAANANNMLAQGKQVVGMLNMDMISYRASGDVRDCDFATNNTSAALTSFCQQVAPLYVANWAATSGNLSAGSSDHASYTSAGFPAAFFFEDLTQYFTQIHTSADAYPTSTNDFDLAEMICKGVLACGATLADPLDLSITHSELGDTTDALGPYVVDASVASFYGSNVTSATLRYRVRGATTWNALAMAPAGAVWRASIPAQGSPVTIEYYLEASDDQGASEVAPKGADTGSAPFDFFVGTRSVIYATGFEEATDNGWTHGFSAGQDDWQRGVLYGKAGDPATAFAGTRVWGNDLGPTGWNGSYANNVSNWLRSPAVDCSGASQVILEFRRWLTVESSQYDQARIKVNGTQVWINASTADHLDTSWVPVQLDLTALAAGNPSVQVEFSLQSDGGVAFGGWNLDEFALVQLGPGTSTCPAPVTFCTAKPNSQGCVPQISSSGSASLSSASAFTVSVSNVLNQRAGLLYYGLAAGASPFQGGTKCISGVPRRTPLQATGGNTGPDDCSGSLVLDFNVWLQSGFDPALTAGLHVYVQGWYRDGADPQGFGTGLSNALDFRICP